MSRARVGPTATVAPASLPLRPLAEALQKGYRYLGAGSLGWHFGPVLTRVYVRRDLPFTCQHPKAPAADRPHPGGP